jgi:S1-C subfamily serine protease
MNAMSPSSMSGFENTIVFLNLGGDGWATGWIDSGKIITCDHAVDGKGPFTFQFVYAKGGRYHLGRKHRFIVLVADHNRDDASLIPVNPRLIPRLYRYLIPTTTPPRIGEKVFAVGFPNRRLTLMTGVYLGSGKGVNVLGFGVNTNPYLTHMRVYPGASGSPLFNLDGDVIGMVEGYEKEYPSTSVDVAGKYFDRVGVKTHAASGMGAEFVRGETQWTTTLGG